VALEYVFLTCDLYDGTGNPVVIGTVIFTPSSVITDADDHILITQAPVVVGLLGNPLPVVQLAATDSSGVTPSSWSWLVSFLGAGAGPPRSLLLPSADGERQFLSDLASA
jgi:hypothetical protein